LGWSSPEANEKVIWEVLISKDPSNLSIQVLKTLPKKEEEERFRRSEIL
jgi:hypothetical protein